VIRSYADVNYGTESVREIRYYARNITLKTYKAKKCIVFCENVEFLLFFFTRNDIRRLALDSTLCFETLLQDVFHHCPLPHFVLFRSLIRTTSSRTVTFRREMLLERVCHGWKMHLSFATTDNIT